jgi:hypothetical protein
MRWILSDIILCSTVSSNRNLDHWPWTMSFNHLNQYTVFTQNRTYKHLDLILFDFSFLVRLSKLGFRRRLFLNQMPTRRILDGYPGKTFTLKALAQNLMVLCCVCLLYSLLVIASSAHVSFIFFSFFHVIDLETKMMLNVFRSILGPSIIKPRRFIFCILRCPSWLNVGIFCCHDYCAVRGIPDIIQIHICI